MSLKEFDEFVARYKSKQFSVTKLKNLNNPENRTSEIPEGRPFLGKLSLRYHEESDYGPGFQLLLDGGWTFSSSLVRDVVQKDVTRWLCKTMNSVYRVEVVG